MSMQLSFEELHAHRHGKISQDQKSQKEYNKRVKMSIDEARGQEARGHEAHALIDCTSERARGERA